MSRTAIFIDGAYLDFTLRDEFPTVRIAFDKFSSELANGMEILRTYYYHCLPYQSSPPTHEERERFAKAQSFMRALERLSRYEVRLGQLAFRGRRDDGKPIFVQKRVDIMLGVDLAILSGTRQCRRPSRRACWSRSVTAASMLLTTSCGARAMKG